MVTPLVVRDERDGNYADLAPGLMEQRGGEQIRASVDLYVRGRGITRRACSRSARICRRRAAIASAGEFALRTAERDRADLAARQRMVAPTRARDYLWIGFIHD